MASFGHRLRTWRDFLGDTQEAFGKKTGIHTVQLRKYEGGTSTPSGEVIARFAATGVNLHWLLTGEGEMRATPDNGSAELNSSIAERLNTASSTGLNEFHTKFSNLLDMLMLIDEDKREAAINEMLLKAKDAQRMNDLERLVKELQKE